MATEARRSLILTLALPGILGAASAVAATDAATPPAPCANFAQVSPGLYRGAEPDERCLEHLASMGIKMVVNLRDEPDDSDRVRQGVIAAGMRYVSMPMSGFGRPPVSDVERILATLRATENQPVFVHGRHGSDRTGTIVAAFRMAQEGWAAERALQEAKQFGMGWWQFRMKGFIRDFEAP